jgi:DNA-binding response OmpR family regulator
MTAASNHFVLIAEDNGPVREALGAALQRRGFRVLLAADGKEALDLHRRHGDEIGVVLLDLWMPVKDGPQTMADLRELNPSLACCFMTGESDEQTREELLGTGASHVFVKPFGVGEVTEVLRDLLGQAATTEPYSLAHARRAGRHRGTQQAGRPLAQQGHPLPGEPLRHPA